MRISKRKKIVLIFVSVGLVALIILALLGNQPVYVYYQSPSLVKNAQYSTFDDGEIYFYSGHGFAKYRPGEDNTTSLTPFMRLPEIYEVGISKDGAVFKTVETFPTDELYTKLINFHLDTNETYWWYVDFKSNNIYLVGESEGLATRVVSARLSSSGSLLVAARNVGDEQEFFGLYKLKSAGLELVYENEDTFITEILWADDDQAIFSSEKPDYEGVSLNKVTFSAKSLESLPDQVGSSPPHGQKNPQSSQARNDIAVSSDGKAVVYQVPLTPPGSGSSSPGSRNPGGLYIYWLGEKEPELLLENFVGSISADSFGGFSVHGKQGEDPYTGIIKPEGKLTGLGVESQDEPTEYSYIASLDQSYNNLFATNQNSILYVLSQDKKQYKEVVSNTSSAQNVQDSAYSIVYLESSDSFSILVTRNPLDQNVGHAIKDLQDRGVDTNQHVIRANPARTIDSAQ